MNPNDGNIGVSNPARSSSRILKPPGGGHSDIFAEPEVKVNPPRPKYNQQNSSNLNSVMNTVDPNIAFQKSNEECVKFDNNDASAKNASETIQNDKKNPENGNNIIPSGINDNQTQSSRGRVPPGGFSSGFW